MSLRFSDIRSFLFYITLCLLPLPGESFCQSIPDSATESKINTILNEDEVTDEFAIEELLYEILHQKIDLNIASFNDMILRGGLDSSLAVNISEYRINSGHLFSLDELRNLNGMDEKRMEILKRKFTVSSPKLPPMSTEITQPQNRVHSFLSRYRSNNTSTNTGKSHPFKNLNRYEFYSDGMNITLITEKDPYEKNLTDYYSGNLIFNSPGVLGGTILGDYKVQFGKGIVLGADYFNLKGFNPELRKSGYAIFKPNRSTNEISGLRGFATEYFVNENFRLGLFTSYNFRSCRLDSSGTILSFYESGYFTNDRELSIKRNTGNLDLGIILRYSLSEFLNGDILALNSTYNRQFNSGLKERIRKNNIYLSFSNDLTFRTILLSLELAMKDNSPASFIINSEFPLSDASSFLLSVRNYSPGFITYKSTPFGENSSPYRERGIYTGFSSKSGLGRFEGYADVCFFDTDHYFNYELTGTDFVFTHSIEMPFADLIRTRLKIENKEELKSGNLPSVILNKRREIKTDLSRSFGNLNWKVLLAYCSSATNSEKEDGILLSNEIKIRHEQMILIGMRFTFYRTDSYASGITLLEDGAGRMTDLTRYYGNGASAGFSIDSNFLSGFILSLKYRYSTKIVYQQFEPAVPESRSLFALELNYSI